MATITQITEMNLPELINYVWENKIRSEIYWASDGRGVRVDGRGAVTITGNNDTQTIHKDDVFQVDVEKTITAKTKIPNLVGMHYDLSLIHI